MQKPLTAQLFRKEALWWMFGMALNTLPDHSFSTYAKFSKKLTFLTPLICTRRCVHQGVRNVSLSESFAYVLNEWSPLKNVIKITGENSGRVFLEDSVLICIVTFLSKTPFFWRQLSQMFYRIRVEKFYERHTKTAAMESFFISLQLFKTMTLPQVFSVEF